MPDCDLLRDARDAAVADLDNAVNQADALLSHADGDIQSADGILQQLPALLQTLDERQAALDECEMGSMQSSVASRGDVLRDSILPKLDAMQAAIINIKAAVLNGEGTHPAIDEGGAGPAPDSGSGPGFDDGTPPGPAPEGDSGGSVAAP